MGFTPRLAIWPNATVGIRARSSRRVISGLCPGRSGSAGRGLVFWFSPQLTAYQVRGGHYTTVLPRPARFVFRRDLVPGLPAMECEPPPRSSLVPTLWRLISAHCLLLPLAACTSVRGLAIRWRPARSFSGPFQNVPEPHPHALDDCECATVRFARPI